MGLLSKMLITAGFTAGIGLSIFMASSGIERVNSQEEKNVDVLLTTKQHAYELQDISCLDQKSQIEYAVNQIFDSKELQNVLHGYYSAERGANSLRHSNDLKLTKQVCSLVVRQMYQDKFISEDEMNLALGRIEDLRDTDITPEMTIALDEARNAMSGSGWYIGLFLPIILGLGLVCVGGVLEEEGY